MERWEGSYTVEMALLLPVIILTMLLPIYLAYDLYAEGCETVVYSWDTEFCAEQKIRDMKFVEEELLQ